MPNLKAAAALGADIRQEIADALLLLDYAVANGVKTADKLPLSHDVAISIKSAADKIGADDAAISAADWAAFEAAYYDLAIAMAPVTADSLRNTQVKRFVDRTWSEHIIGDCSALRFTRLLWLITLLSAAFVLWSGWYLMLHAEDASTGSYAGPRIAFELLTPWVYGGLGACVFLLRSAHTFIYQRCFDIHRKPEYFNRILLGAVAGGAILLFVDQITDDNGQVIKLSSAALGFLAGYNTDFLFSTIERVSAAILPKVGIDTVQTATSAAGGTHPVDINDLVARMQTAQGAEKQFLQALIARQTGTRVPPPPPAGG